MKVSKTFLIIAIMLVVGLIGAYFLLKNDKAANNTTDSSVSEDGPVTFEGISVCLPHRNTEGPQTMECAIGLQTSDDIYYALNDTTSDYSLISKAGTGEEIRVTGTLTVEESDKYQSSGTIAITSLEKL